MCKEKNAKTQGGKRIDSLVVCVGRKQKSSNELNSKGKLLSDRSNKTLCAFSAAVPETDALSTEASSFYLPLTSPSIFPPNPLR